MTLVLSCITQDYAIQVSDRRLTWLNGPNTGEIADDNRNKAVVICNRMAFAYSGLAEVGNVRTDDWLLEIVSRVQPYNPRGVLDAVRESATTAFQNLNASGELKRHAFVAVGWARLQPNQPLWPFLATTSNALNDDGQWLNSAVSNFVMRIGVLPTNRPFLLAATGQALSEDEDKRLKRELRLCVRRNMGPASYVRVLAETIRRSATVNQNIGKGLLAVSLPRAATAQIGGLKMPFSWSIFSSEAAASSPAALYIPPDQYEGVGYGPHYTCGGMAMKDVTFGPLPEGPRPEPPPPWSKGPLVLSRRVRSGDVIKPVLEDDYQLAGYGLVAEASYGACEGEPSPCLMYIGPSTPDLAKIQADPRYFVVMMSGDEIDDIVDHDWIEKLISWLTNAGLLESRVRESLAEVKNKADVVTAVRQFFRSLAQSQE